MFDQQCLRDDAAAGLRLLDRKRPGVARRSGVDGRWRTFPRQEVVETVRGTSATMKPPPLGAKSYTWPSALVGLERLHVAIVLLDHVHAGAHVDGEGVDADPAI